MNHVCCASAKPIVSVSEEEIEKIIERLGLPPGPPPLMQPPLHEMIDEVALPVGDSGAKEKMKKEAFVRIHTALDNFMGNDDELFVQIWRVYKPASNGQKQTPKEREVP